MAAVNLEKFKDLAARRGDDYTQPPYRVPSEVLDKNFAKVCPVEQQGDTRPYSISATDDGWELVPEVLFDVCENGKPVQYKFVCQRAV